MATSGVLPRELRKGEFYCNDCKVFVLYVNRDLHRKFHNQGCPKSNLINVKVMPGFTGDYKPKETAWDKALNSPELKSQGDYLNEPTRLRMSVEKPVHITQGLASLVDLGDAPACTYCGAIMVRNGSCYKCNECGGTSGCS